MVITQGANHSSTHVLSISPSQFSNKRSPAGLRFLWGSEEEVRIMIVYDDVLWNVLLPRGAPRGVAGGRRVPKQHDLAHTSQRYSIPRG